MSETADAGENRQTFTDAQLAAKHEGIAHRDPLFEAILAARSRLLTAKILQRHETTEEPSSDTIDPAEQT